MISDAHAGLPSTRHRLLPKHPPPPHTPPLSLHDALPISCTGRRIGPPCRDEPAGHVLRLERGRRDRLPGRGDRWPRPAARPGIRSEEHTSELQSRGHLVCRLLLEKKKKNDGGCCALPHAS